MADYWKSQPKKFCQYCKCWIADNKPSIEFHERGKNHKENVAKKIEEIKKKSIAKAKKEEKMSKEFAAMEEAALKAYQEDIKRLEGKSAMPQMTQTPQSTQTTPKSETTPKSQMTPKSQKSRKSQAQKRKVEVPEGSSRSSSNGSDSWIMGTTDNGHIYYYNTLTGESQWEKPEWFQGQNTSLVQVGEKSEATLGSSWREAVSTEGYTYYYNTETGESSWERPEGQEDPSPPGTEPLSTGEESSNGDKAPAEAAAAANEEPKTSKVAKISFRERKEENVEPSEEEEKKEGTESDSDSRGDAGKEGGIEKPPEKLVAPAKEEVVVPVKKPRKANPYGSWEKIKPEVDPYAKVDLQLPQFEACTTSTVSTADLPPEPKPKFKERTITSLGDDAGPESTFRRRKTENGKSRSLRQRGKDD
ncbi:WW domain-binding protein 4 [Denticeps clupeoides]|uniref:WW domain-binding protein 4 n=1 Tax=Denticeps clupeoides TaxID=299321 RepID=A0AAY4C2T7_9TELE|nr:WW domain-binding protein 4 [Denticeps clupeoides]